MEKIEPSFDAIKFLKIDCDAKTVQSTDEPAAPSAVLVAHLVLNVEEGAMSIRATERRIRSSKSVEIDTKPIDCSNMASRDQAA